MNIVRETTDTRHPDLGRTEPAATFSLAEVMHLPLGPIISRLRIRIISSSITDAEFFGAVVIRNERIILLTSPGRDKFVTECLIRYLVAQALGLDVAPLPKPFEVEFTDFTERVREAALEAVMK